MKAIRAVLAACALLTPGCWTLGPTAATDVVSLLNAVAVATLGSPSAPVGTLFFDAPNGKYVSVIDGQASVGLYFGGSDNPVTLNNNVMLKSYNGQHVVLLDLVPEEEGGLGRTEIGLKDFVPPEWVPFVGRFPPRLLASYQARDILRFPPSL